MFVLLGLKGKMEEMTGVFLVGWMKEGFYPLRFGCPPFLHLWRVARGGFGIGGPSISLSGVDGFRLLGVIFGLVMTLTEGSVCLGVLTLSSNVVWSILGGVCK